MAKPNIEPQDHITRDLMRKASDDVLAAMSRTLAIAPAPHLPIAASAAASAMGFVSALLEHTDGRVPGSSPDPDCVLLAGLLCARMAIGGEDPIGEAYADLKLITAARVSA